MVKPYIAATMTRMAKGPVHAAVLSAGTVAPIRFAAGAAHAACDRKIDRKTPTGFVANFCVDR